MKRANVNGRSNDIARGSYCTPREWADRVGPWDLDPFSNPRSHVVATRSCMLERGDDGLAGPRRGEFFLNLKGSARGFRRYLADDSTRVWLQPPYKIVDETLDHYGHTRFGALLRFDSSTKWFARLYKLASLVCVPRGKRIEFEAPPGVKTSKNPYPHAFYFARVEDATPAILRACFSWRTRP